MKLTKSIKLAFNILTHSKMRSWLTIIGIVIGVAAVVAIVSIGEGLQQNVQIRLGGLGADLITISPGGGRATGEFRNRFGDHNGPTITSDAKNLTKQDIQTIQAVENIKYIQGTISGNGEAYYLSEKATISIDGVDPQVWSYITISELETGRFLGPSDTTAIVVGNRIAKNTFKQPLAINRIITIEGKIFKIVGILKESGGFGGDDRKIIMPIKTARTTLEDVGTKKFDSIVIQATNVDAVDKVIENVNNKLLISRHVTERTKDYRISSAKARQEQITDITQTMTLFLGAIAAVSLIVGAVGIANTMFTSVLEKRKEIGIMKAIGAKNKDILLIFLFNSAMVGMVGGLIGITFGSAISFLLPALGFRFFGPGSAGGLTTVITPQLILFALGISVSIGILAGVIPAYQAAKLNPVDALRYE